MISYTGRDSDYSAGSSIGSVSSIDEDAFDFGAGALETTRGGNLPKLVCTVESVSFMRDGSLFGGKVPWIIVKSYYEHKSDWVAKVSRKMEDFKKLRKRLQKAKSKRTIEIPPLDTKKRSEEKTMYQLEGFLEECAGMQSVRHRIVLHKWLGFENEDSTKKTAKKAPTEKAPVVLDAGDVSIHDSK